MWGYGSLVYTGGVCERVGMQFSCSTIYQVCNCHVHHSIGSCGSLAGMSAVLCWECQC